MFLCFSLSIALLPALGNAFFMREANPHGTFVQSATYDLCMRNASADEPTMACSSIYDDSALLPGVHMDRGRYLSVTVERTVRLPDNQTVSVYDLRLYPGMQMLSVDNGTMSWMAQIYRGKLWHYRVVDDADIIGDPDSWVYDGVTTMSGKTCNRYVLDVEDTLRRLPADDVAAKNLSQFTEAGLAPDRYYLFEDRASGHPHMMTSYNTRAESMGDYEVVDFQLVRNATDLDIDSVKKAIEHFCDGSCPFANSAEEAYVPYVDASSPSEENADSLSFYVMNYEVRRRQLSEAGRDADSELAYYLVAQDALASLQETQRYPLLRGDGPSAAVFRPPNALVEYPNACSSANKFPACFKVQYQRGSASDQLDVLVKFVDITDKSRHAQFQLTLDLHPSKFNVLQAQGLADGCATIAQLGVNKLGKVHVTGCMTGQVRWANGALVASVNLQVISGVKVIGIRVEITLNGEFNLSTRPDGSLKNIWVSSDVGINVKVVKASVGARALLEPRNGLNNWALGLNFRAAFGVNLLFFRKNWGGEWRIFTIGPLRLF